MILPAILFEGARTHSCGEGGVALGDGDVRKKFVHVDVGKFDSRRSQLNQEFSMLASAF